MGLRERQIEEATKRMRALKISPNVIKEFLEGKLNESERVGCLYWLNENEEAIVKAFEEKFEAVAYHVIHQFTNIGELYNILYVSKYEEEWENDMEDIAEGQAIAYVLNRSMPDCSELGSIGIKPSIGGLVRTW